MLKLGKIPTFYLYKISQSVLFSFAISVYYFKSRGIDLTGLFIFESIYAICIVLMELPTGIVSDLLGRKFSIQMANILRLICHVGFVFCQSFSLFVSFTFSMESV